MDATARPLVVSPQIGRLYAILDPERLAGVLSSALDAAVKEAREADASFAPPCAPETLVAQAREALALVWSEVEPKLAAFRDECARAGAVKAARDEAARVERERVIREREAKAAEEAAKKAREERAAEAKRKAEEKAAETAAKNKREAKALVREDRTAAERKAEALRAKLAALEAVLAKQGA